MSSYTPDIPQSGDDPSNSQQQILENFQTLNSLYGTTGDHYSYTNQTAAEKSKHARVTLPALPTSNAPGDVVPTPGSDNCAIFGLTRDSQTTPFLTRDGLASPTPADFVNLWPLMPIKAFANVTVVLTAGPTYTPTINESFNITSIVIANPGPEATITMTNQVRTQNYAVLAWTSTTTAARLERFSITDEQVFKVRLPTSDSTLNFCIIEP